MLSTLLALALTASPAALPPEPPAVLRIDDDEKWEKRRDKEERKAWKRREKEEDEYWKHERKWEKHRYHDRDDDQGEDHNWDFDHPRHRHPAPAWMNSWWRPDEQRYCAVDPRDPGRVYVFVGGQWILRRIVDPRFRADVSGAFSLPVAPPPVPLPPHLGLDLHVVLFN